MRSLRFAGELRKIEKTTLSSREKNIREINSLVELLFSQNFYQKSVRVISTLWRRPSFLSFAQRSWPSCPWWTFFSHQKFLRKNKKTSNYYVKSNYDFIFRLGSTSWIWPRLSSKIRFLGHAPALCHIKFQWRSRSCSRPRSQFWYGAKTIVRGLRFQALRGWDQTRSQSNSEAQKASATSIRGLSRSSRQKTNQEIFGFRGKLRRESTVWKFRKFSATQVFMWKWWWSFLTYPIRQNWYHMKS